MELIDARTCKCSGEILIFDSPLEDPVLRPVTVQVSKLDWKLFEAICRDREKLVEEFRNLRAGRIRWPARNTKPHREMRVHYCSLSALSRVTEVGFPE